MTSFSSSRIIDFTVGTLKLLLLGVVLFSFVLVLMTSFDVAAKYGPVTNLPQCKNRTWALFEAVRVPLAKADQAKYVLYRTAGAAANCSGACGTVVFIPGNGGSYEQGSALSVLLQPSPTLQSFSIDFGHEASIAYASTMHRQARFVVAAVAAALADVNTTNRTVIFVAHSMGGAVMKLALSALAASATPIAGVRYFGLTLSTPHQYLPMFLDSSLIGMYNTAYNDDVAHRGPSNSYVAFTSGTHDLLIRPRSTRHYGVAVPVNNINYGSSVSRTDLPTLDHNSIATCECVATFLARVAIPLIAALPGPLTASSVLGAAVAPFLRTPLIKLSTADISANVSLLYCSNVSSVLRLPNASCIDVGLRLSIGLCRNASNGTCVADGVSVAEHSVECDPMGRGVWVFVSSPLGPYCVTANVPVTTILAAPSLGMAPMFISRRAVVAVQVRLGASPSGASGLVLRLHCGVPSGGQCPRESTWDVQYFSLDTGTTVVYASPFAASVLPYTVDAECSVTCSALLLPPAGIMPDAPHVVAVMQLGDHSALESQTATLAGGGLSVDLGPNDAFVEPFAMLVRATGAFILDSHKLGWLLGLPIAWLLFAIGQLLAMETVNPGRQSEEPQPSDMSPDDSTILNDSALGAYFIMSKSKLSAHSSFAPRGNVSRTYGSTMFRGMVMFPLSTLIDTLFWRFPWVLILLALCGHSMRFKDFVSAFELSFGGIEPTPDGSGGAPSFDRSSIHDDVASPDGAAFLMDAAITLTSWLLAALLCTLLQALLMVPSGVMFCLRKKKPPLLDSSPQFRAGHLQAAFIISSVFVAVVAAGALHSALGVFLILLLQALQMGVWASVRATHRPRDMTLFVWTWMLQFLMTACGTSVIYATFNMARGLPMDDGTVGVLTVFLLLSLPLQTALMYDFASVDGTGPHPRWYLSLATVCAAIRPRDRWALALVRYVTSLSFVCDTCASFIVVWGRMASYRVIYACTVLMGVGTFVVGFAIVSTLHREAKRHQELRRESVATELTPSDSQSRNPSSLEGSHLPFTENDTFTPDKFTEQ